MPPISKFSWEEHQTRMMLMGGFWYDATDHTYNNGNTMFCAETLDNIGWGEGGRYTRFGPQMMIVVDMPPTATLPPEVSRCR